MLKRSEIKKILLDWTVSTTAHGFTNIANSKSKLLKFVWLFCLICSSCYCSYCLFRSFADYFSYKVNIQYTSIRYPSLEFPTVTFCSLNRFKIDSNSSNFMSFLNHLKSRHVDNYLFQLRNKNPDFNFIDGLTLDRYLNMIISEYDYKNMSQEERNQHSFKYENLVINCRFNENQCSKQDFEHYYSSTYGSCFKFNSNKYMNGSERDAFKISRPGKNNGLMLELFTGNSAEYSFKRSNGIRMLVHNKTVPNMPLNEGIYLSPGFETNVVIDQINSNRLSEPHSDCIEEKPYSIKNLYFYKNTLILNGRYEQKFCLSLCYQKFLIDKCDCHDSKFPSFNWSTPCQSDMVLCLNKAVVQYYNSEFEMNCFKNCPVECSAIDYNLKISFADYPTEFYSQVLLGYDQLNGEKKFMSIEHVKKTTLAVNVYYDDISLTDITELPSKTIEQLIAEIGGIMGLCIGTSFLSFIEIIDLFVKITYVLVKSNKNKVMVINEQKKSNI